MFRFVIPPDSYGDAYRENRGVVIGNMNSGGNLSGLGIKCMLKTYLHAELRTFTWQVLIPPSAFLSVGLCKR